MTRIGTMPPHTNPIFTQPKFGKIELDDYCKMADILSKPDNKETFAVTVNVPLYTASDTKMHHRMFQTGDTLLVQSQTFPTHDSPRVISVENPFVGSAPLTVNQAKRATFDDMEIIQLKGKNQQAWTLSEDLCVSTSLTPASVEKLNRLDVNS